MNKFNFDTVIKNFEKAKIELPKELANDAQKFFNDSFRKQSFDGKSWAVPHRRIPETDAYKYPKKKKLGRRTSATLVRSGRLRRTVATSLKSATFDKIRFLVDLPYAAVHNDGLKMRWGGNMPTRTFMKDSPNLRKLQQKKINKVIDKIWQG